MEFTQRESGLLVPRQGLIMGGVFHLEHVRDGEIIDAWDEHNLIVNEGLDATLNIMFHGSTQISTWYVGLFEGNYTPVATLTAATFASAATECTAYSETVRQDYNEAASSGQSITNSANKATFTFNAAKTIYGAALLSNATKGGTSGTLFSATRFGTAKSVVSTDQLLVTYTLGAASA